MKYSVRNAFNHIVTMGLVAVGLFATTACNPEPDESDLYTSTGKTTLDFIKEDPNLSSFLYIMERVGLDKNLAAYGQYTCFIPNNQAVATYINDLYNDDKATVPHNSMTENSLQGLTDSLCNDIAKYHLAIGLYPTLNINPTIPMMLGRSINTETTSDSEGRVTINHVAGMQAGAVIVDGDHEMINGIVHLIDNVIPRNTKVLPEELRRYPQFSLFLEALNLTGLSEKLRNSKKNVEYPKSSDWKHTDTNGSNLFAPEECRVAYTIFAETNDVLDAQGINNINDLIAKTHDWYGNAETWYTYPVDKGITISTGDDYTNPFNTLNMFIAYHILYAGMPESELVYEWISQTANPYWNYVNGGEPYDYYETMLPNTLMKIWQPNGYKKEDTAERRALYINRYQTLNTLTNEVGTQGSDGFHVLMNEGVRINRTVDKNNAPTNIQAYNGYIHSIRSILLYDKDVPQGVLHERMRFDSTTFLPEFINNEFRMANSTTVSGWNGGGSGARIAFPLNYVDGVVSYTSNNEFRYNVVGAYNAWQSNTFQGWGKYDLAVKMPPLPENTYEFRIFYTPMGHGGMMQFYMGSSKELGSMMSLDIPLDVRVPITDPRIGWTNFLNDDDLGLATDAALRTRGYMRGLYSYADHAEKGDCNFSKGDVKNDRSQRYTTTGNNSLRRILGRMKIKQSDERWLRIKSVITDEQDLKWQLDYVEFVPIDVVDNQSYTEDWF